MILLSNQVSVAHRSARQRRQPPRILTAVPICDGHDSAIMTVNVELVRQGVDVVYLGYHRSVRDIVRAAIQEDVQGIGISSYNGGHIEFFNDVLRELRRSGAPGIGVFGGGGGTITPADARLMKRRGVEEIFFPGAALTGMARWIRERYSRPGASLASLPRQAVTAPDALSDVRLAKLLSAAEAGVPLPVLVRALHGATPGRLKAGDTAGWKPALRGIAPRANGSPGGQLADELPGLDTPPPVPVIGITGPGGAGKTTLIDELVLRLLAQRPNARLAILSHDPGAPGRGALLGDRATLIYAQDDRVFMRSLAARGQSAGLARATRACLELLRVSGLDLVLVESAGIGQESLPFQRDLADQQVLVMSADYGARLQLQKISMLNTADIVVVNKADLPGARTALAEVEERLAQNARGQKVLATVARRHRDPGVDRLCRELCS